MKNNIDHYTYRVTWSAEDDEHVGLCAEFPSLSWLDKDARNPRCPASARSLPMSWPTCRPAASRSLSPSPTHLRRRIPAFAFRQSSIGGWRYWKLNEQGSSLNRLVSAKLAA